MRLFWHGKPRDGGGWSHFRIPGGQWVSDQEFAAFPDAKQWELLNAHNPDLIDWYDAENAK